MQGALQLMKVNVSPSRLEETLVILWEKHYVRLKKVNYCNRECQVNDLRDSGALLNISGCELTCEKSAIIIHLLPGLTRLTGTNIASPTKYGESAKR